MTSDNFKDQCSDMTKEFNIQIPCRLAERIEAEPVRRQLMRGGK